MTNYVGTLTAYVRVVPMVGIKKSLEKGTPRVTEVRKATELSRVSGASEGGRHRWTS